MRVPIYEEQQVKTAPLPGLRASLGGQTNAALELGHGLKALSGGLMNLSEATERIQAGADVAEEGRLRRDGAARMDAALKEAAFKHSNPTEYNQAAIEGLKSAYDTTLELSSNERVRTRLQGNLDATLIGGQTDIKVNTHLKTIDKARGDVDTTLDDMAKRAVTLTDQVERSAMFENAKGLLDQMTALNYYKPKEAADKFQAFQKTVNAARAKYFDTDLQDQLDNFVNQARRDPVSVTGNLSQGLKLIDAAAEDWLPEEKLKEVRSKYKDSLFSASIKGRIDVDPKGTKAELKSGVYDKFIDQRSLDSSLNEADAEIARREAKAKAERSEYERRIGKLVTDYKEAKMLGFDWRGPVTEAKLGQLAKGTEHETDFANVQAAGRVLGQFNQLPPAAQEQHLRQSTEGAKTGTEAKFYGLLEGAHKKTVEALKTDPLTFAIRQRLIPAPAPLNLDNPGTMQARSYLAGVASQRYGVPVSPLSDDEAAALKGQLDNAPADVQAAILRKLSGGFDSNQIKSIASQFAKKDDKLMAFTMGTSLQDPGVASRILQGKQIIKENPKVMPTGADAKTVQDKIQGYFGEAFMNNPEHNAAAMEAAQAIYAFKSWQTRDLSGAVDPGRAKAAAEEATGGLLTLGRGIFSGGYKIQPPKRGMNETDFWTAVNAADYSKVQGFKKDDIVKHGTFESVGDGKYLVRVGPGYVQGDRGPFILNLSPAR